MHNETAGVATEEFVRLKPKMNSQLVHANGEHKKAKGVNRNTFATISHIEFKDVLQKIFFLRHIVNRIQNKDHKIGTYEISKVSLSCFHDKLYKKH